MEGEAQEATQYIYMGLQLFLILIGFVVLRLLLKPCIASGSQNDEDSAVSPRDGACTKAGTIEPTDGTSEEVLELSRKSVAQGERIIALLEAMNENLSNRTHKN